LRQVKEKTFAVTEQAELEEKQGVLWRRIMAWNEVRKVYLPYLLESDSIPVAVEALTLMLPSSIPLASHPENCLFGLVAQDASQNNS
jgi:hypothetical protein